MSECFKDMTQEDLKAFSDRYPQLELDVIIRFVATVKRCHWILNLMEAFFNQHNLSFGRFGVMIEVFRRMPDGPISPFEIAERYGAKAATITGLLDNLERDGMLARVPNQNDRRRIDLSLTEEGMKFMEGFLPRHYAMMSDALSELDDEERKTLIGLLSKMYQGISRHLEEEYSTETDGKSMIK